VRSDACGVVSRRVAIDSKRDGHNSEAATVFSGPLLKRRDTGRGRLDVHWTRLAAP